MLVLISSPSSFDYNRLEIHELFAFADNIVLGSISSLEEETFVLAVEEWIVGEPGGPTMRLKRFVDWTCATRWAEYRVGQRVLLFVREGRAMGAGDEGDWPVQQGEVLIPYFIHDREPVQRIVEGERSLWAVSTLSELRAAARGYRVAFASSHEEVDLRLARRVRLASTEEVALAFARSSPLAQHLYEATLSSDDFVSTHLEDIPPPVLRRPQFSVRQQGMEPAYDRRSVGLWSSQLGDAMVSPGDVDADGWADLAVHGDDNVVWIFFLTASARIERKTRIAAESLGLGDLWIGQTLAPIGDFDGDGVPDLGFGSWPKQDQRPGPNVLGKGPFFLLLLNRDGSAKDVRSIDGASVTPREGMGSTLASIGDLDGNGVPELAIGIDDMASFDFADLLGSLDGSKLKEKELPLLFLGGTATVTRAASLRVSDFLGSDHGVTFADSLVSIGDLDGDGRAELGIGYPFDRDGGEERGAVWIAFLGPDGVLRAKQKVSDWAGDFGASLRDGDHLGQSLAAPGDLDADGIPDLIVAGDSELWILLLRRDGTVKDFGPFGRRAGGFVPTERNCSLAVLRQGSGLPRLAISGRFGKTQPLDTGIWILELGPGAKLSVR
jgi:hypothetical protein